MKKIMWLILLTCGVFGCSGSKQSWSDRKKTRVQERTADTPNARNSLDYQGTYTGVIPGNECKTINVSIVLTECEYVLRITPLRENAEKNVQKGEYTWDENGCVITLEGAKGIITRYFVVENQLRQLDANGKQHKGEDAANYVLRKRWKS